MKATKKFVFASLLMGSLLSMPWPSGAADKGGMMEHDKGMTKDDKEKMKGKEAKSDATTKSDDKMKMDDKMKK